MYICVHVCNKINEKEAMDLENQNGIYGKVWREKRKGKSDIIILISKCQRYIF